MSSRITGQSKEYEMQEQVVVENWIPSEAFVFHCRMPRLILALAADYDENENEDDDAAPVVDEKYD